MNTEDFKNQNVGGKDCDIFGTDVGDNNDEISGTNVGNNGQEVFVTSEPKEPKIIKNYGLIVEPLSPEDWLFGSSGLGMEIRREDSDWTNYLPTGEKQKRNDVDKMCCVTASALNVLETEFIYQMKKNLINQDDLNWLKQYGYLDENGLPDFSDRFIAYLSGTSQIGNSFKKVADTIRKYGLIPETRLPYRKSMTWNEFYNPNEITNDLKNLGQEWLKRFPVNYEFVTSDYSEARKRNPLQVAIHAYNGIENDIYVRTELPLNHAVENQKRQFIYDSYEPYEKQMAPDFIYMNYSTRFIISFKKKLTDEEPATPSQNNNLMTQLYQNKNTPDIYFIGKGDKLYHRIGEWDIAKDLYSIEELNTRIEMIIPEEKTGRTIFYKESILKQIIVSLTNIWNLLRGVK